MTLLIVQQGSAIQSQSNLIKVLLRDSTELWTAKGKAISDQQVAKAQTELKTHAPSTENQPSQNSAQSPSTEAPSTQAAPQHRSSHASKFAKPQTQAPPVPASDLVDRRRALTTI
jgi:hypothetical protein